MSNHLYHDHHDHHDHHHIPKSKTILLIKPCYYYQLYASGVLGGISFS